MSDAATAERLAARLAKACANQDLQELCAVNAELQTTSWSDRATLATLREQVTRELETLSTERNRLARELQRARRADQGIQRYREITDTVPAFMRR